MRPMLYARRVCVYFRSVQASDDSAGITARKKMA